MLNIKEILSMIGYNGECHYKTLREIHDDPNLLFTPLQKLKLECIKNIALEIQTDDGPEYKYPEGYDPESDKVVYEPLENIVHRKEFHPQEEREVDYD